MYPLLIRLRLESENTMNYMPKDILDYVIENEREADFLVANTLHKSGYSIGEITDARFIKRDGIYLIKSKTYNINSEINDTDIINALDNNIYVSAFLSRLNDNYHLQFFVHNCSTSEKDDNAEIIARTVVQFMIYRTIITLRLDSIEKVEDYMKC